MRGDVGWRVRGGRELGDGVDVVVTGRRGDEATVTVHDGCECISVTAHVLVPVRPFTTGSGAAVPNTGGHPIYSFLKVAMEQ